jgi:hypothetical protein
MRKASFVIFLSVFALIPAAAAYAQAFVDVEAGAAFTGYNDAAVPADTGTRFSLADDLSSDPAPAFRMRVGYTFADRHTVSLLAAPLTVRGEAVLDEAVTYRGKTYAAGERVNSLYRFDSYRLTYRYEFVRTGDFEVGAGLTAKIRSAEIALMGDSGYAVRSNLGVVPLINLRLVWKFCEPFSALLDADALVSPYGRAEDALIALQYHPSPNAAVRLGYRILEGGSDGGGNVYTFALFHYLTAGVSVSF